MTQRPAAPVGHDGATPFWTFSLALYARPSVAEACLTLQDRFGADVNLLLFAAWLGRRGIVLDEARLVAAYGISRAWQAEVASPLRDVRRRLKMRAGAEVQALRQQVKASELEAERLEQMALQALAADWPRDAAASVPANLLAALPVPGAAEARGLIAVEAMTVPCG